MKKIKFFIILTLMLGTSITSTYTECTTPKNKKGVCIYLQDCSILRTHFPSNRDFLQKSVCGYKAKKPKVCCPMENESPPVTQNVIDNVKMLPLHTTYETSKPILTNAAVCKTPKREKGVCIKMEDCPIMLNLLSLTNVESNNKKFIQKSFCANENGKPKVCCPLENEILQWKVKENKLVFQTTNRKNKAIQTNQGNPNELKCETPNKDIGVCIDINDCTMFVTLREKNVSISREYLRQSLCGYKNKNICCPLKVPIPSQKTCGMPKSLFRIIGGKQVTLGQWPWMAALGYQSSDPKIPNSTIKWKCGGTLISTRYVLTATHCMNIDIHLKLTTVRLGELDLNENVVDGASPLDFPVEQIVKHPGYNNYESINDIALLKLKNSVTFNDAIQPICLPIASMRHKNLTGINLFVAGWGKTKNVMIWNDKGPGPLMAIEVLGVNISECINNYSRIKNITKIVCTRYPNGRKGTCHGDSGGPLMWQEGFQYYLMGIVSKGPKECATQNYPSINTRVPSFMDWVVETVIKN